MTNIKAIALKSEGDEKVRQGDYNAAIRLYQDAVQIDPQFLRAWNNLGYCLAKIGKTEEENQVKNKINEIKQQMDSGEIQTPINGVSGREHIEQQQQNQISKPELYFATRGIAGLRIFWIRS